MPMKAPANKSLRVGSGQHCEYAASASSFSPNMIPVVHASRDCDQARRDDGDEQDPRLDRVALLVVDVHLAGDVLSEGQSIREGPDNLEGESVAPTSSRNVMPPQENDAWPDGNDLCPTHLSPVWCATNIADEPESVGEQVLSRTDLPRREIGERIRGVATGRDAAADQVRPGTTHGDLPQP